jgi:hypothetical protein
MRGSDEGRDMVLESEGATSKRRIVVRCMVSRPWSELQEEVESVW